MRNALILFTRVPVPGQTKTRLMPFLNGEECAAIHSCFVKDIFEKATQVEADVFVFYTPEEKLSLLQELLGQEFAGFPQEGNDLGEKMKHAIGCVLDKGYEKAVLIGTDIPHLGVKTLEQSFENLDTADIVINPTFDGGYYLIGMKREYDSIWKIERYGTNTVIQDTLAHMERENLSVTSGDRYYDIDDKEDLKNLYGDIQNGLIQDCPHTIAYLEQELKDRLENCDV